MEDISLLLLRCKIWRPLSAKIDVDRVFVFGAALDGMRRWVDGMIWQEGNGWKRNGEGSMVTMSFPILLSLNKPQLSAYFHFFSLLLFHLVLMEFGLGSMDALLSLLVITKINAILYLTLPLTCVLAIS